jgi:hypothetical protein
MLPLQIKADEIKDDRYILNPESKYIETMLEKQEKLEQLQQKLNPILIEMDEIKKELKKALEGDIILYRLSEPLDQNNVLLTIPKPLRSTFMNFVYQKD